MNGRPPSVSLVQPAAAAPGGADLEPPAARRADQAEDHPDDSEEELIANLDRLVAEAMSLATAGGRAPDLADLISTYWRLVPDEDLGARTPEQMLTAVEAHLALAQQRLPGELKVDAEHTDEQTVLRIVTDDMPFLVDSVTGAISAAGHELGLLAHPQVVVRREALGRLIEVRPDIEPDDAGPGDLVESWMRVEVGRIRDEAVLTALRNDLQRILTDVREAVEDWPRMRSRALSLADDLATAVLPVPDKDITDSVALLRWLADDHFTFLGYREYRIVERPGGEQVLEALLGTGLGILRRDPTGARTLSSMSPEAYERVMEKRLLIITKANSRSTVHRPVYLDYIGFKVFDSDGNVSGERRFLGLFSSAAYLSSVRDLPVVKRKVAEVIARSGLSPRSHSGKDLMAILEDYPREELFQIATDDLFRTVMGVLRLAGRRQVKLFARKDQYGRFISCLVYLPKDRFNTGNRLKIQEILLRELQGIGVDYTTRVTDSTLARIHFIVRTDTATSLGEIDAEALTRQIADATRLWDDDFAQALERKAGEVQARMLVERYGTALPEIYKDSHTAHEASKDVAMLELLEEPGQLVLHLFRRRKNDDDVRFKMFRHCEPMALSDILPVLHSLGVRVHDERPYEVRRSDAPLYVYDFGLALPDGYLDVAEVRSNVENAFAAAWRGDSEVDGFNALVLNGLTWRQVLVLRAYAKYLRQVGSIYSHEYVESALVANAGIAALLVRLFETRLDPASGLPPADRAAAEQAVSDEIRAALDRVDSLDQDRILRSYLTLIHATLRTSYFQRSDGGRPKAYVAFKLDPRAIPDLPQPRPMYEIFVYSPWFEGVHLRFGAVARGGLRWSDRREDFRTEVLGLVKAQMVKNAVIVPVGAKGGFVLKRAPAQRDQLQAEGVRRYREFVSAMLDVTDNLVGGEVVAPNGVVRHDGDDPYLVVAADKGTAAFSDIANEIAHQHGFWLGDAFASGGSAGYDHKGMGITARGAWESVRRHFRELGLDVQTEDFTVVGIGDMSGDVFGNGMLRSKHIRLVAAFDHRHVFVDPTPDAVSSFAERDRLFRLPRSSWNDYDRSLISAGGGVWPRTAKSVPVSPEMRTALGIDDDTVTTLSPPELIRVILRAPVDLLWNGGIGTYVKASTESHLDVGDKANDAVRIDGSRLRAKVVGEGGNLGFTQHGRIEYALSGGRTDAGARLAHIYTDFIDNSAGVDCSDHEVNIKILLGAAEAAGELSRPERDRLLAEMTDEVADLVLRDNYLQAGALGIARVQAAPLLPVHRRMIKQMEKAGQLDRALEALPTDKELDARAGVGLTPPELAVLFAYSKMVSKQSILDSTLPDEEWTAAVLTEYFPTPLRKRYAHLMPALRLRREIVTTSLVNEAINRGGTSFLYRAVEESGAGVDDVLRAYVVVRDTFGLRELWKALEALDGQVPTAAQTAVVLDVRRLMDRAVRWLVANRRTPIDVPGELNRFGPGLAALQPRLAELTRGQDRRALLDRAAALGERGIPVDLASWVARITYSFGLLDVIEVAHTTGRDLDEVADVYFLLSDQFQADHLLSRISALPREDRWQTLARMALRYDLYAALAALTAEVLAVEGPDVPAEEKVRRWEAANAAGVTRTRTAIADFDGTGADLATLSVLLRQIRNLVRASAARAAR